MYFIASFSMLNKWKDIYLKINSKKLKYHISLHHKWPTTTFKVDVAIGLVEFAIPILVNSTLSVLCYLKHPKYVAKYLCGYVVVSMKICYCILSLKNIITD